jgi:hypothetical protein
MMTIFLNGRELEVVVSKTRVDVRAAKNQSTLLDILAGLRVPTSQVPRAKSVEFRLELAAPDVLSYELDGLDDFEREMLLLSNALFRERKQAERESKS